MKEQKCYFHILYAGGLFALFFALIFHELLFGEHTGEDLKKLALEAGFSSTKHFEIGRGLVGT